MRTKDHWQAIYDTMRAALDADGFTDVPVAHTTSIDTTTGYGMDAPFVVYRQDVERSYGTVGGGALADLNSGWVITSYAEDLEDGLDYISAITTAIVADNIADTDDGYRTTGVEVIGVQTLYEPDFRVYATHLRVQWSRTAT